MEWNTSSSGTTGTYSFLWDASSIASKNASLSSECHSWSNWSITVRQASHVCWVPPPMLKGSSISSSIYPESSSLCAKQIDKISRETKTNLFIFLSNCFFTWWDTLYWSRLDIHDVHIPSTIKRIEKQNPLLTPNNRGMHFLDGRYKTRIDEWESTPGEFRSVGYSIWL